MVDIQETNGRYKITRDGRVFSFINSRGRLTDTPRELKPNPNTTGYLCVQLHLGGRPRGVLVHRLVATAFLPPSENRPHVNHIDGNIKNNDVSNFEWCNQRENYWHARDVLKRPGLQVSPMRGKRNSGASVPVKRYDADGGVVVFSRLGDAAKSANGTRSGLWRVLNCLNTVGKRPYRGYLWEYAP